MIKQSTKPKRGQQFIYNGNPVWLEIIRPDGTLLVCDNEARNLEDNYFEVKLSDLKPVKEMRQGIATKNKPKSEKEKSESQKLNDFFDEMAKVIPFNCQSCGKPLYAYNKFAKRCCTAHILAKGLFPSIATNKDNIVFLGAGLLGNCNCHDLFDGNIDSRIKLPIYKIALQRYEFLKQLLTNKEIDMANKLLNI